MHHASAPPPGFEPGSKVPKTRVLPLHHGGIDPAGLRPCVRIHTGSWSGWRDSDPRPPRPERGALPSCATSRNTGRHGRRPWQPHWDSNPDPRIESPKCADQAHREAMIDMRMRRAGAPTRIRTGILKKSRVWAGCVYQLRHRGMSVRCHSSPCPPDVRQGGVMGVGMTGFEPATSCSQSRRAARLRHIPKQPSASADECPARDSNPQPSDPWSDALSNWANKA